MIKHLVMFKLAEGHDPLVFASIIEKLNQLPSQIPEIKAMAHGPNAAGDNSKYDYGLSADFETMDDCQTYLTHPAHQALGAELVKIIADAGSMQFSC